MVTMTDRSEWLLAEAILNDGKQPNRGAIEALAREVLRLRELAEVRYELLRAEKGYDVLADLSPRIQKLYLTLNAEGRGDEVDLDGDAVDAMTKWNRLVELVTYTLVRLVAAERWAALEHRAADELRASMAMVNEGAPLL
jgi:hypothetical protein